MDDSVKDIIEIIPIQKVLWENLTQQGVKCLTFLCNLIIQTSYLGDSLLWGVLKNNWRIQSQIKELLNVKKEKEFQKLEFILTQLDTSHRELKAGLANLRRVCNDNCWSIKTPQRLLDIGK